MLKKHKKCNKYPPSIINIIGLAIGIASSVLISLYVHHEMSYDSFNEKKEQLYRVNILENIGDQAGNSWATSSIVGPTIAEEFPEVEAFLRITPIGGSVIKINKQSFFEDHRIEADSTFFDFFTIPLLQGDPKNVLNTPYTAVLSESAILSLASLVIAIVIIELILPYFNNILQLDLDLEYFNNLFTLPGLLILALAIGLLSGLYPAFFLSGIRPIVVLKGAVQSGLKNVRIRKILVIFQFAVSIMLIIGTLIMYKQVNYMQHKNLGFNKESLLIASSAGSLGLFGMTSYSLAQRTREIGVRRTMGATVSDIYVMISKEIIILVGIATIISWTAIFFIVKSWLQNFHYHIAINPLDFILGFLIALIISILTITFRTLKAARMNPAISLKYE